MEEQGQEKTLAHVDGSPCLVEPRATASAGEPTTIVARAEYLLRYLRACAETSEGFAKTARTKQRRLVRAVEAAILTVCIVELERVLTGEPFGFTLEDEA